MQNICAWRDLCQYRHTDLYVLGLGQQGFVPVVLQEWAHGEAFQSERHGMSLIDKLHYLRQQFGIGELNLSYLDIALLHIMAASLSGRQ